MTRAQPMTTWTSQVWDQSTIPQEPIYCSHSWDQSVIWVHKHQVAFIVPWYNSSYLRVMFFASSIYTGVPSSHLELHGSFSDVVSRDCLFTQKSDNVQ